MAKRKAYDPKGLYVLCKAYREYEEENCVPPMTLAEIWSRATKEDAMGNAARYRRFLLNYYLLEVQGIEEEVA